MIHFAIQLNRTRGVTSSDTLNLHADNCPGQNNNQFMLILFIVASVERFGTSKFS